MDSINGKRIIRDGERNEEGTSGLKKKREETW
jgi:hypothetical protein